MVGLAIAIAILRQGAVRVPNVIYWKLSGSACTLDVFKPKVSNHKSVIWLQSFGWYSSDDYPEDLEKAFNDRGFTFIVVHHGSPPNFTIDEIVPMIQRAVRFVRFHARDYGIDSGGIGLAGANSGGHLALEIGGMADEPAPQAHDPIERMSDRPNALFVLNPLTDFENWKANGVPIQNDPAQTRDVMAFGAGAASHPEMMQELAYDLSPIHLVRSGFPPTLIVQGDADDDVPLRQSVSFDAALAAAKVTHKLVVVHGSAYTDAAFAQTAKISVDWFDRYLVAGKTRKRGRINHGPRR